MNPIPVALVTGVVVVIPPLRRRVIPVTAAVAGGVVGVVGAAFEGTRDVVEAVINGPRLTTPES